MSGEGARCAGLSGWCGQRGRPDCGGCRVPESCGCSCHLEAVDSALPTACGADYKGGIRAKIRAARTGERELTNPGLAPVLIQQNERLTAS